MSPCGPGTAPLLVTGTPGSAGVPVEPGIGIEPMNTSSQEKLRPVRDPGVRPEMASELEFILRAG